MSAGNNKGIVIVGAGECGVRAAFSLREAGYNRSVTLVSEEHGLPYERPPLSKSGFDVVKLVRQPESYGQAGITLLRGVAVESLDRSGQSLTLSSGESLPYTQLLLTTGAAARVAPGWAGCLTLRTEADARAIKKQLNPSAHIGLIGGGFIGLELAATARAIGASVTVIEAGNRLLERAVPAQIATIVQARHEVEGVELMFGAAVNEVSENYICFTDGQSRSFDFVVAGIGSHPNTSLAINADLEVDNGIVVDQKFQTSDPLIYSAGDCCCFPWRGERVRLESWRAAQDQGQYVAQVMAGQTPAPYNKVPWFWSDQYDLVLQVAGLFRREAQVYRRPLKDNAIVVFQCDDNQRLSAAAGVGTGNSVAKEFRILEKLIERKIPVNTDHLSDPGFAIKKLLKG